MSRNRKAPNTIPTTLITRNGSASGTKSSSPRAPRSRNERKVTTNTAAPRTRAWWARRRPARRAHSRTSAAAATVTRIPTTPASAPLGETTGTCRSKRPGRRPRRRRLPARDGNPCSQYAGGDRLVAVECRAASEQRDVHDEGRAEAAGVGGDRSTRPGDHRARGPERGPPPTRLQRGG